MTARVRYEMFAPYASYVALGVVVMAIFSLLSIKLVWRDSRFISDPNLTIYCQPEQQQRKNHVNKRQDVNKPSPPE